jgi:hypothetical protein
VQVSVLDDSAVQTYCGLGLDITSTQDEN